MSRHPIDVLAPLWYRLDRRARIFQDGWGDEKTFDLLDFPITAADPLPEVDPVWGRKEERTGYRIRRGRFTSPAADVLPDVARAVTVEWVEPAAGTDRTVVLLPAWNDETTVVRRRLATHLARSGVGSLIPDIPLYGARRIHADSSPAVRTVSEFALLAYGAVSEARALVGVASGIGAAGIAGFSMGGSLAAGTSATLARPVATTSLAGAHGPAPVFTEGPLRTAIAWKALGGRETGLARLRQVLDLASVRNMPQLAHHPAAVVVSGARDGIVDPAWTRALAVHWDAEYWLVDGAGHGTLLWRHGSKLADAIVRSFDRLAGHD